MAASLTLETQLAQVRELSARPIADVSDRELAVLLASKHSAVVQRAAALAGQGRRESLSDDLAAAFERFMIHPERTDRGCLAKFAIVNTLCGLDHRDAAIYLRGVRHVQREPSFGGAVDTAGELRGRCAIALAECNYPDAMLEIAPLLADADVPSRVGGIRAVAAFNSVEAAALLRFKLLSGDREDLVMAECTAGLLAIEPEKHIDFLASFLESAPRDGRMGVLAALGESRQPAALTILRRNYESARTPEGRKAALEAIAVLRVDGAEVFLLDLVTQSLHPRAREVIESLQPRKGDSRFRARLAEALTTRDDAFLTRYACEVLDAPH